MPRIFAFGSRTYDSAGIVSRVLNQMHALLVEPVTLVTGDAYGADALAVAWARGRKLRTKVYSADWATHGRSAGAKRTAQLVAELPGDQVVCVGFVDRDPPPAEAIAANRQQDYVTPGTRITVGMLFDAGYRVKLVWRDGSVTWPVPVDSPARPPERVTAAERLDAAPPDDYVGELGWDAGTSAAPRRHKTWYGRPRLAELPYAKGDTVIDPDGKRWRVESISPDRKSAKLAPLRVTDASVEDDPFAPPLTPLRGFGDGERRSADTLRSRARFEARGSLAVCAGCHDTFRPRFDGETLCSLCSERLSDDGMLPARHAISAF